MTGPITTLARVCTPTETVEAAIAFIASFEGDLPSQLLVGLRALQSGHAIVPINAAIRNDQALRYFQQMDAYGDELGVARCARWHDRNTGELMLRAHHFGVQLEFPPAALRKIASMALSVAADIEADPAPRRHVGQQ